MSKHATTKDSTSKAHTDPMAGANAAGVAFADAGLVPGEGGELHQRANPDGEIMTTANGIPISDDFNSLKAGPRGGTMLEDFVLREKVSTSIMSGFPSVSFMPAASRRTVSLPSATASPSSPLPRSCPKSASKFRSSRAFRPSPAIAVRPTSPATFAGLPSNSIPNRAIGTLSAIISRCSSSRMRSSFLT